MRRLPRTGALVVCAAFASAAAAGCGDDGDAADAVADDPTVRLLQRAAKTGDDYGQRLTFSGATSLDADTLSIHGYGQSEAGGRRSRTVVMSGGLRVETFADESFAFISADAGVDLGGAEIPSTARWLKFDRSAIGRASGATGRQLEDLSTSETIDVLAGLHPRIASVGEERVGDAPTRHYRVTTQYRSFAAAATRRFGLATACKGAATRATLRYELWIDARDMIRRARLRVDAPHQAIVLTTEISSYDRDLHVNVPSGPTVFDATKLIANVVGGQATDDGDAC